MTRVSAPLVLTRIVILLVAGLLLAGCVRLNFADVSPSPGASTGPAVTEPGGPADWDAVASAVVLVAAVDAAGETLCSGSGTLVDSSGTIVTNFHVVEPAGPCAYDRLLIGVAGSVRDVPSLDYVAEVHAFDASLDLAVLRISGTVSGGTVSDPFPFVAVGDSDGLGISDALHVFGYPGIGGQTITSTQGEVSGFTTEAGVEGTAWIKTDASLAGGNSGGLATDDAGRMVGIPTRAGASDASTTVDCRRVTDTNGDGVIDEADTCVPIGGFINSIRPVNLARPLIEEALTTGAIPTTELAPASDDPGEPAASEPTITALSFAEGADASDKPIGAAASFPSGVDRICAFFTYTGMGGVTTWDAVWSRDGEVDETASMLQNPWTWVPDGDTWLCTGVPDDTPLADGGWELSLYFGGDEPLVSRSVWVGDGHEVVGVTVRNDLAGEVCYLYISPGFASSWESDRLGEEDVLVSGDSTPLSLPAGDYDVLAEDCTGKTVVTTTATVAPGAVIALTG